MKKKIVSWFLATAMVLTCAPMNVSASDFDADVSAEIIVDAFDVAGAEFSTDAEAGDEQETADVPEDTAEELSAESAQAEENTAHVEAVLDMEENTPDEETVNVTETDEIAAEETSEFSVVTDAAEEEIPEGTENPESTTEEPLEGAENTQKADEEIPEAAEFYEEQVTELEDVDFEELAAGVDESEAVPGYVLMNIPYSEFYAEEGTVDVVSGATVKKRSNSSLAGGSYHVGAEGEDITGVTFPVKIGESDLTLNPNYIKADNANALFENVSYAYTTLGKEPEIYKELNEDGSFGPVQGTKTPVSADVSLKLTDKHADYVLDVKGLEIKENISAVVLETANNAVYGLRHVNNIWTKKGLSLGWNKDDKSYASLTGDTVSKITFITTEHIYEISTNVEIKDIIYVLMNIPYDEFYANELASGSAVVDAVSSATKNKSRTIGLSGGSYHINADGSDITGIVYPVKLNPADLEGKNQITDESEVNLTVTNRGQTSTTKLTGKDALFEAPSYSYYLLSDKPKGYKVLENGSFSAVKGLKAKDTESQTEKATASMKESSDHTDYEISINDFKLPDGENLSAAYLTDEDGKTYGLRHVANIWRNGIELGWNKSDNGFAALEGKTIKTITYITQKNMYEMNVNVPVESFQYVLMNIPYNEFYAAELASGSASVDAVSSATKNKPRTTGLAGGSYHVNADGSDITGVIYPVKIQTAALGGYRQITDGDSVSITVTNRGTTSTTTLTGKDALFEAPSYSYYILNEKPARFKTAAVSNGKLSFSAVNGRAASQSAEAEIVSAGKHTFYEMTLTGVTFNENISAAYLTDEDGKTYGLRHIANLWRGTEIGWKADEFALSGKTIKKVTYITQSGKTEVAVDVKVPVYYDKPITGTLSGTLDSVSIKGLPEDLKNAKASVYFVPGNRQPNEYIAQDVQIVNGVIALTQKAKTDTEYTVSVSSDNYAVMQITVKIIDLSKGTLKLSKDSYTFNGKERRPGVTVTLNNETVSKDYYDVEYTDHVEVGTALATVTGKNGYYGSLKASFKITRNTTLRSKLNAGLSAAFLGKNLNLTWGKVSGADGYEVFVEQCGKKYASKPAKTIKNGTATSLKLSKLNGRKFDLTKNYKVKISAYRMINGKKTKLAGSYSLHAVGSKHKRYTNAKKVSFKKSAYSVKVGKTVKLSPAIRAQETKKAILSGTHVAQIRYWSTDSSVASVKSDGKVTGIKKGTCYIYAMAANGVKKRVKITVK